MQELSTAQAVPVAIIGASALFPGSINASGFWRNILAGTDLITDVPETHWLIEDYYDSDPKAEDKTYCKRGGFLPDVDFDPVAFGIPPTAMPSTDTAQLLALVVARQVLEDAFDAQFQTMDKERMSVILGVTAGQELLLQAASRLQRPQWLNGLRESGISGAEADAICDRIANQYVGWQESTFPGLLGNVVAGRIANRFDLGGTNCITDAACASSLSALAMGLNELYLGYSDVVITGGVDCFNDIFMYMCFSKTPALSPTGDCRPFSDQADGTLMGEGLGMFAMKRLDDAERDGDRIYAVVRGLGSSSDGRAKSVYAPLPEGQARAINRAYERAGYEPRTVELMEAHGTATKAGDLAELQGLCLAFETEEEGRQWCALGSIKSQIGHTKAAAGAAGLFKIVMALHHKVLPPTIKVARPSDKIDFEESPFYVNTEARPWIRDAQHPRRASISSFGFGGSNYHVALEEYTGEGHRAHRIRQRPVELVALSAASVADLLSAGRELAGESSKWTNPTGDLLSFLAKSTQERFDASAPARLALIASSEAELAQRLADALNRIEADPTESFTLPTGVAFGVGPRQGKLAMLFPGQGSQYVGMGSDLAMAFDSARDVWD
ncbi:MAG: beta-ketoacyl synthase N-terminal-like domain-containing protein, partial [Bradymonadaceae bacterium]